MQRQASRGTSNDNDSAGEAGERERRAPPVQPTEGYSTLECAALLEAHSNDAFELETFVALKGESATATFGRLKSGKDVANQVAQLVWSIISLHVC